MRKVTLLVALFIAFGVAAQEPEQKSNVRVPDAAIALRIAVPKLKGIYGEKQIESEQPFTATLKDGVWFVGGTLCCSDGHGGRTQMCAGGVAQMRLRQRDGKVLSIIHTK